MIKNIHFRKVNNSFQSQLNEDIKRIKRDSKIFVPTNKARNIYKMHREVYEKLLHESITKTYKKTDKKKVKAINVDAKIIAKDLEIEDRIEKMQESDCYITVKDHEEDFPHKISCRLINPSKPDIGKLSQIILDKISSDVLSSVQVNQQKILQAVVEWFKNTRNKNNASFIVFDIESFYPSISPKLFHKAINFVKTIRDIPDKDISIIMQSIRKLLFNNKNPLLKKFGNEEFDVPMGFFDSAEVCELVGV